MLLNPQYARISTVCRLRLAASTASTPCPCQQVVVLCRYLLYGEVSAKVAEQMRRREVGTRRWLVLVTPDPNLSDS